MALSLATVADIDTGPVELAAPALQAPVPKTAGYVVPLGTNFAPVRV
jgi:hypothetical protein